MRTKQHSSYPTIGTSVTFVAYDGTLVTGMITRYDDDTTAVVADLSTGEAWGLDVVEDDYTEVTA